MSAHGGRSRDNDRPAVSLDTAYLEHIEVADLPQTQPSSAHVTSGAQSSVESPPPELLSQSDTDLGLGSQLSLDRDSIQGSLQPDQEDPDRSPQGPDAVEIAYRNSLTMLMDPSMKTECLDLAAHVFGRPITEEDFAHLTSAVPGAQIDVIPETHDAITLDMFGPGRHVGFTVARLPGDRVEVRHVAVHNYASRSVITAGEIINTMLLWEGYGVTQVTATALRDQGYNGYHVWARLGFQGDIPIQWATSTLTGTREVLPILALAQAHFAAFLAPGEQLTRVEQLMHLPGGSAWWKENGCTWTGTFDLTPGSYSMQTLDQFRRRIAPDSSQDTDTNP